MYKPCRSLVVVLCLTTSGWASEDLPDPRDILDKMSEVVRKGNYDGVFVYSRGNHMDTLRIIHKYEDGQEYERLISLTGPPREVVRSNTGTRCIFPEDKTVMVSDDPFREINPASTIPELSSGVDSVYQFNVLEEQERIAGRMTWAVSIKPHSSDRYGYRLWVDKESYLLLKSNILDSAGAVLEQVLFTNISLPEEISSELLQSGVDVSGFKTTYLSERRDERADSGAQTWEVSWVPQGFAKRKREKQVKSSSKMPLEHLVFSDGLATVSVFVEKLPAVKDGFEGHTSMGAVNTYSTMQSGYQITVVGELPRNTVKQIAGSVTLTAK